MCIKWNRSLATTVDYFELNSLSSWASNAALTAPNKNDVAGNNLTAYQLHTVISRPVNDTKSNKTKDIKPRDCWYCGKAHASKCFTLKEGVNPNCRNNEKVPWAESTIGKAYKKLGWNSALINKFPPGYVIPTGIEQLYSLSNIKNNHRATVQVILEHGAVSAAVSTLLDTGAQSNFISYTLVNKLKLPTINLNKHIINDVSNASNNTVIDAVKVCGALQGQACTSVNTAVSVTIYHTGVTGLAVIPYNTFFLVGNFEEDLIIGSKTIKAHNLALSYPEHFFTWKLEELHHHLANYLVATSNSTKWGESP